MRILSRRRAAGIIAVGGAAALIAAGCGGGGDNGELSSEEYLQRADAICAAFEEQLDAIDQPTSADGFVPFLRQILPIIRAQIDELRELNPPSDIADQVDEAENLLEEQADITEQTIDRVEDGGEDPTVVANEVGPRLQELNQDAEQIADDIGLQECGSGGGDTADTTTDTAATAPATAPTTTEAAPTTADPGTTEAAPTGEVELSRYLQDLVQASTSLAGFGRALQTAATDPGDLDALAPELQSNADEFEQAIDTMSGYTIDNAAAESQRERLVREGPRVAELLQQMVDKAEANDAQALIALAPELTEALQAFQPTGG